MSERITLVEVGPRDGLQNEKQTVTPALRIELINRLANCGLSDIEAGAFVSPKWVPQMAQSDEVLRAVNEPSRRYWMLVPNLRGFEDAVAVGAKHIAVFTAASETFSQKNTNASIEQSLQRIAEVTSLAKAQNIEVRGYVSCALGCPYEGEIKPTSVLGVTEKLLALGCSQVSIGDTIGVGTIASTRALFGALTAQFAPGQLAAHFHDTYGQALANLTVALDKGIRTIDSSVGGLGGCPYAPGATGNVATEDVVRFCEGQGLATGIDMAKLAETGDWISSQLSRPNASRVGKAILAKSVASCE
jgi:hydroxymethylglutaryl-CoA lyase